MRDTLQIIVLTGILCSALVAVGAMFFLPFHPLEAVRVGIGAIGALGFLAAAWGAVDD